jgi:hypothetical protein
MEAVKRLLCDLNLLVIYALRAVERAFDALIARSNRYERRDD